MISMKDALPDMPEISADEHLEKKIRHGRKLTTRDLIGINGIQTGCRTDGHLKIIDRQQDLIAIVKPGSTCDQWRYCCVFPRHSA
jgi:hypothetical protein